MVNITDIISYAIAIIGCLIGVSGYLSGLNKKASKDGQVLERIDQMYRSLEEMKIELKERTSGLDRVLDNHTERIIKLEDGLKELRRKIE